MLGWIYTSIVDRWLVGAVSTISTRKHPIILFTYPRGKDKKYKVGFKVNSMYSYTSGVCASAHRYENSR